MVTYGFYDSINHDRRYNAFQFGSIFDGIIRDGVYMSIGTCFRVTPPDETQDSMMVTVGIGRAWFNHTWTLNDAPLPIPVPQSELLLDRIDAIVIDIKQNLSIRENKIVLIKGTPSKTPERPTLINGGDMYQYPLAYISVRAGVTRIRTADITNMVGTSQTPYVTGIINTVNIDALLDQWEDQWAEWFENETRGDEKEWEIWFENYKSMMEGWKSESQNEFMKWFETLEYILQGDVGAKLTLEILDLKEKFDNLLRDQVIYDALNDSSSETIIDSNGGSIDTRIIFEVKENKEKEIL